MEAKDDIVLVRCIVKKDAGDYFKAEDYNGKKYIIQKNHMSKRFKKGTDETFYAIKRTEGLIIRKDVLYPMTTEEFHENYSYLASAQ